MQLIGVLGGALLLLVVSTALWTSGQAALAVTARHPAGVYAGAVDPLQYAALLGRATSLQYAALSHDLRALPRYVPLYFTGTVVAFSREVQAADTVVAPPHPTDETLVRVRHVPDMDGADPVVRLWYNGTQRKLRLGEEIEFVGFAALPADPPRGPRGEAAPPTVDAGPNVRLLPAQPAAALDD